MIMKYRLHEVAKDLNVNNKEIIDLLAKYFQPPKKYMTALTEEELNIVFDYFTQKNSVTSFDQYFATKKPKAAPAKQPAAPAQTAGNQEKAPQQPAAAAPKRPEAPAASAAAQRPAARPQQPLSQRPAAPANRNNGFRNDSRNESRNDNHRPIGKNNRPQNQNRFAAPAQPVKSAAPKKPQHQAAAATGNMSLSDGDSVKSVRRVDTRTVHVDLDKYNDKYEQIAPSTVKDFGQRKQKINQKSAQRGKPAYSRKETEADKLKRLALEKARKHQLKITVPDNITVGELASRLKVTASEVIKKLMALGVMASVNETVDYDTAELIATELGAKVEREVVVTIEERLIDDSEDDTANLQPRSPVVVVMGHVDHGKTSLLDAIRHTNVTSGEAGGITQHIGAYRVRIKDRDITFLDTPGHEAFTSMRARGAQITDIAVLVVAADDGIMPQTIEAINHAKAAGVSIIVAINKMDKPGANTERVMQQLTEYGLVAEEWGGDTICVPVSAVKHQNIDTLLEMILLVADVKELKANPGRLAKGTVIEARLDKGRGPVATILVQNGTLKSGDVIIAGTTVGRVRAMVNDKGQKVETAGPSVPVEITGLSEVPQAGDIFNAVEDEKLARELVEQRKDSAKEEQFSAYQKVTLDNLFSQIAEGEMKELPIIVKADVQGTAEAVKQSLEKLSNEEVRVKVIHCGVGAVSESDVMLANASNAIIVGFNIRPEPAARDQAKLDNVDVRLYRVIYDAIEEIKSAMKGMLSPKTREVELGRVEVREVYKITNVGTVAGCYVLEGKITRSALIRVVRDGVIIADDQIDSLKRFKDDVKEVARGYECGVGLTKYNDIRTGDIYEAYQIEEYRED